MFDPNETFEERKNRLFNDPQFAYLDIEKRKLTILFDEIALHLMLNPSEEISQTWIPPNSIKIVLDEIMAPSNREILCKWYSDIGDNLNIGAYKLKEYIEFSIGEKIL